MHGEEECVEEQGDIHGDGPVLEIVEVVVEVLVDGIAAVGADLPDAGEARLDA